MGRRGAEPVPPHAYHGFMQTERRLGALGALSGGIVAISWSAIFVRWSEMPGVASAFYRMVIAAVVLWPLLPMLGKSVHGLTARTLCIIAAGGVFFAGDVGLWNVAVMHTSAGNATFLSNIAPLFVGLFTWMLTRKLPSGRFWTALLVSLAGSCLIVTGDLRHAVSRSYADGLAVLAAVCFALFLVITGRLRERIDTALLLALSTTASAVTLLIWAACAHISLAVPGIGSWWALLGLGLVCQVGGYFGLTYALGHLPVTVSSILWLTIAPLTAVFAWLIFGERMTPIEVAGGALVLTGVWIVGREEKAEGIGEAGAAEVIPPVAQV
jgi:drug/metabolite transporter (DMT)-like permease